MRASSTHETKEEAIVAARKLAAEARVIVHEESRLRLADHILAALIDSGDLGGGSRTTLRVPATLEREVAGLAGELGLTKNEALVRLALTGSQVVERARDVAAKREARRAAVFAARGEAADDYLPSLDEMREAALALRSADE